MFTKFLTRRAVHQGVKSPLHVQPSRTVSAITKNKSLAKSAVSKTKIVPIQPEIPPNAKFFSQLKAEENRLFPHKKRARFSYKDNLSAALALPYSTHKLMNKQNDQDALLALSKQNIIEHSNRRVDLFFYTLIAYYKTGVFPTSGHTMLQHGRGRTTKSNMTITEACHSSITPSLLDNTIYHQEKAGVKRKSLLSDTHFMDSLNSTVELPHFANAFDDLLENTCRQKSIDILYDVSLGTIDPIKGLTRFLKMMDEVLNDLKQNEEHKSQSTLAHYSFMKHKPINPKLIDLVQKGTLGNTFSKQIQSATDEYVQLLLRLDPKEKMLCENELNKGKIYEEKIMSLQSEIVHTQSLRQCR